MPETSMGGTARELPQTAWSRLIASRDDERQRAAALEHLAEHYWKPVYFYIRRSWRKPVEESKDLAQAFFAWATESDVLSKLEPTRGRFRSFLKVVLRNFLNHDHAAKGTVKRGGRTETRRLDLDPREEAEYAAEALSPDDALDAAWKASVLDEALRRLEREYDTRGKRTAFEVFKDHDLAAGERPDYESLARKHGVTRTAISDILTGARTALRGYMVEVVAESVTSTDECRDELRELFGMKNV
jgi:RNA polymerase sigma factor (sigma-70 family)